MFFNYLFWQVFVKYYLFLTLQWWRDFVASSGDVGLWDQLLLFNFCYVLNMKIFLKNNLYDYVEVLRQGNIIEKAFQRVTKEVYCSICFFHNSALKKNWKIFNRTQLLNICSILFIIKDWSWNCVDKIANLSNCFLKKSSKKWL